MAAGYPTPRALIGEVWLADAERFARYLRPDEMHAALNFDFLECPWQAKALRACIDNTLASHGPVGAPPTWVLANHDVTRTVTRYGRAETDFNHDLRPERHRTPTDERHGLRRARAAALLSLALPGSVYIYQGEELGLPEVEDLPDAVRQDPIFHRTRGANPGRDGCRVPLPWSGEGISLGFSPAGAAAPWLPQPAGWSGLTVAEQRADRSSMLHLYRTALGIRARESGLGDGPMTWLDGDQFDGREDALAFRRPGGLVCVVNLSAAPIDLPAYQEVLLASTEPEAGRLPADTAAWLRIP